MSKLKEIMSSAVIDLTNRHEETTEKNRQLISKKLKNAENLGAKDIPTLQNITKELILAFERDEIPNVASYVSIRKNTGESTEHFLHLNPKFLPLLQTTEEDILKRGIGKTINSDREGEAIAEKSPIIVNIDSFNNRLLQQTGIDIQSENFVISSGQLRLTNSESVNLQELMNRGKKLRKQLEDIIKEQQIDPETGLKNKNAFDDHLKDSLKGLEYNRSDIKTISLIIMNIDNFEDIKGNHEKLREVANYLKKHLRSPRDIIFRINENEFCLIMINQDINGVKTLVKKLKMVIKNIGLSLLVGTAGTYEPTMADCKINDCGEELISRAKQRRYAEGINGKDNLTN